MKKTKLFRGLAGVISMCIASLSFTAVGAAADEPSRGPSGAEITYYEAEDAVRTGDLWEGSFSLASGGKAITQISCRCE